MNSSLTSPSLPASKVIHTSDKDPKNFVIINEKVNLTKNQHEVLKIICDTYEQSISEYIQEVIVEAMRYDIEEGNFSDVLLDKLDEGNEKKKTTSTQPNSEKMN
jgi:hypothetical protein